MKNTIENLKQVVLNNINAIFVSAVIVTLVIAYIVEVNNWIETKIKLENKEIELIEAKQPSEIELTRADIIKYVDIRTNIVFNNEYIDKEIYDLQITKQSNNELKEITEYKIRCNQYKIWQQFEIDCEEDYMNYPVK